jgi:hypothetical protein
VTRRLRRGATGAPLGLGVALALLGLAAAGCGGGSKAPAVANPGTTRPATTSSGKGSTGNAIAFAACMRTHGVPNFPDPSDGGGFDLTGIERNSQFQSAQKACQSLAPTQTHTPAQVSQHVKALLAYAACMRKHGLPWFPDPTSHGGFVITNPAAVHWNPSSPQFEAADRACRHLSPGTG